MPIYAKFGVLLVEVKSVLTGSHGQGQHLKMSVPSTTPGVGSRGVDAPYAHISIAYRRR
ncbi:hypothetical protein GCM10010310_78950 [Streptomyces violaceolatus]|uniref:Uncharacterized protein n=1 Tax=Streptomyces violaceolatus TaxID=67378 RepID=A0ABN3TIJ2_9ACTN